MSAAGDKILGSIREARAILRGESAGELVVHVPPEFDVKALRRKLGMSQSRFASELRLRPRRGAELGAGPPPPRGPGAHPAQGDRARPGRGAARFGRIAADWPRQACTDPYREDSLATRLCGLATLQRWIGVATWHDLWLID